PIPVLDVDPALEEAQRSALGRRRAARDATKVQKALGAVADVAATDDNLMTPMRDALAAGATIGEVSDSLRSVFGVHRPSG
ncbi:MAG: methylmalonyl-CoA mutase family protein, partial [Acidimicrobiia bacterium]